MRLTGHLLTGVVTGPGQIVAGRAVPGWIVPEEIADGEIEIEGGWITRVGPRDRSAPPAAASARWIVPGFVDIHCHGGGGGEFGPDPGGARAAIVRHRGQGTTSLVASLVSAPADRLVAGVGACAGLVAAGELAGIHLEGPFLSEIRCGAQDPRALTDVDLDLVERLQAAAEGAGAPAAIVQQTFAPERPGAGHLPAALADLGALAAVGHTDADARLVRQTLAACAELAPRGGRPLVTHLFNGMPPLHHRSPGPVAAALASAGCGEAVLELIADGVHLHPDTVRMVFDTVGPQGICLVSDAMSASGSGDGEYQLGQLRVRVADGAVRLVDGGSLAGGLACMLDLVRVCVHQAGVRLADAVVAATSTPAAALGLADVGRLEPGRRADLVLLDDDLALVAVLRHGEWLTPPPRAAEAPAPRG